MNERLKLLRCSKKLTQEDFASKLGLSRNFIAQVEAGSRNPSERTIRDICNVYKVNYQWLVNGLGEMYADDDGDAQAIVDSVMSGDNEFAKSVLVKFAKLSEERWRQIKEIMEAMMQE